MQYGGSIQLRAFITGCRVPFFGWVSGGFGLIGFGGSGASGFRDLRSGFGLQ